MLHLPFISFSKNCVSDLDNVSAWNVLVPLLTLCGESHYGVYGLVITHAVMKNKSSYHIGA
jgi:hypothetical protein